MGEIPRLENRQSAPLSFAQSRLWFLDQLQPDTPLYNLCKACLLTGDLKVEALQKALDAIVARHEVLRTTFRSSDGIPVQIIEEERPVELTILDLRSPPEKYRNLSLTEILRKEAQRPFNLSADLMLRGTLLQQNDQEHVLLLTTHHIASDGWSVGIFLQEFAQLYRAFALGDPITLTPLPVQYADFAVWQTEWLQGQTLERQVSYWKQKLGNAPATLQLPLDRPRPPIQTYVGKRVGTTLPAQLSDAIKKLGQSAGSTLYMTLLAAFNVLLYRYTGEKDLMVGSPIAGRTRVQIEPLIGFFVNTLVLRTDLSGNPTFHELLRRVREVAWDAYGHQDLPFEKLVEELQPERSLSHSPLFQVMFILQNAPKPAWELPGLTISPLEIDLGIARFDLMLMVTERGKELDLKFDYNTDLFEDATILRFQEHFRNLLKGILANPDQRISELPLLSHEERNRLLVDWNDTDADYPRNHCVHQLVEAQVERSPSTVAVVCENQKLTFAELNRRSNQLAHYLQSFGVGPEVLVGICLERSIDMLVGLLGILKAGGAYVPLDPAFPRERLRFMLEDSQPAVLLTDEKLAGSFGEMNAHVVKIDSHWGKIAKEKDDNVSSSVTPENLAYVIYTSGSTGKPKGVEVMHQGVVNLLTSMAREPGLSSSDVLLAVTSLSFDIAVLELFLPIVVGAKLVIATREAASSERLLTLLQDHRITAMQATPATWRLILQSGWRPDSHMKILCGGERLRSELAAQLFAGKTPFWNLYGPTETTIWSTIHPVESSEGAIPIGRPISNTQAYILDTDLNPVPIGVPGELYLGGAGVARGYRNGAELSSERFIPNMFAKEGTSQLYRTGDLVRYQPDGSIQYIARIDHQVKIRGFRIEPGEIEFALAQHPAIAESVVVEREDTPGDNRLVAYLVSGHQAPVSISELRSFLLEKLPEYMVPSSFIFLQALPLTPNGKVDRAALPTPTEVRPELGKEFKGPRTYLEEVVSNIWCEILKLEKVGILDNFFELGGHSLLATQIISRLRDLLQMEIPLRYLFESPTISALSEAILKDAEDPLTLQRTAQVVLDVSRLSDKEVESLLANRDRTIGSPE